MSRRTVDITVDAYDAPMLVELAKRRDHQRELGHGDEGPRVSVVAQAWGITAHDERVDAGEIKHMREEQHDASPTGAESLTILMGEVAEALEARSCAERIYELLDVAAVCVRIASKMQRDLDARGST